MKIVAVYEATVQVEVVLGEFETWEDAAAAVAKLKRPPPPPAEEIGMSLELIWDARDDELYNGHELIDACALCGAGIVDGCGLHGCDGSNHAERSGGWVSTKHGHRIWCSPDCRSKDSEDPEKTP